MQFSVNERDGPARTGEFIIENKQVRTPNIFYVHTDRFNAPDFADILITNSKQQKGKPTLKISNHLIYPKDIPKELHLSAIKQHKKDNKDYYVIPGNKETIDDALKDNPASLFVVANAFQLFQQPKKFVDFIVELREKVGYQKTIYLPTIGNPSSIALLAYMGIDFFDSISAIRAARANTLLFPTGDYAKDDLQELPCSCPSCTKVKGKPSEMNFQEILNHNYFALSDEIKQVRNAIAHGRLRGLVETRVKVSPTLTAILRNLDTYHSTFLEERAPITSKSMLLATTKESLSRPEIKRFQERVITRYQKPESAKILLLLPCSAKKPYSFSKSHQLYKEQLYASGNPNIVHEVIITSPLGLVPRELELIHPAAMYDIPVTGVWDEDEKKMIRRLLKRYLEINKYDKIIVHLPSEIMEFIKDLLQRPTTTCVNSPTSRDSLNNLSTFVKEIAQKYEKINTQTRTRENMQSLASYQFGNTIAKKLLKDCKIRGKYPYQKIMHNNHQLGMLTKERGLISLTVDGAQRIADAKTYWIEIYDDFTLKGSVFAPGIKDADESIRIGDEVVVLKNKTLCAVGVAQMNGNEMIEATHGEAVKIRHRI
jgi:archaeosine synthase